MNRKDLDELTKRLHALAVLAPGVAAQLDDLYSIAYDRKVGTSERIRRTRETWYLDEIGEPEARDILDDLAKQTDRALVDIVRALAAAESRLIGGPSPDTSMRGTLLGDDDGNDAAKEHGRLLKAQQRRQERGEYTPVRTATQPRVGRA